MGESFAQRPMMRATTVARPTVGVTTGHRPTQTVTVAPLGSVPPLTPVRLREHVVVSVPLDVTITGVPAVKQALTVPVPSTVVGLEMTGGAFGNDLIIEVPSAVLGLEQTARVPQDLIVQVPSPNATTTATSAPARMSVVGTSSAYASNGVITMPTPSVIVDDLMVMFVGQRGSTNAMTTPSGWTYQGQTTFGASRMNVFYKFATGSEPATFTVSPSGNNSHVATIAAVRLVNKTAPIHATASGANTGSGSSFTTNEVTTTVPWTLVLQMGWVHTDADISWSSPTTERVQVNYPNSSVMSVGSSLQPNAGTVAGAQATVTGSAGRGWVTVALAPI